MSSPSSTLGVVEARGDERRMRAFYGALLAATADFGVSFFAPVANIAAAQKGWTTRETVSVAGAALFAFVIGPGVGTAIGHWGTVRVAFGSLVLLTVAYCVMGLCLLSTTAPWAGTPAFIGTLNLLGVCGSVGFAVTTHKVVADTIGPANGDRALGMSLLHSMTLGGPRAVIFLLTSKTTEHAAAFVLAALSLEVAVAAVGIIRLAPYYAAIEPQSGLYLPSAATELVAVGGASRRQGPTGQAVESPLMQFFAPSGVVRSMAASASVEPAPCTDVERHRLRSTLATLFVLSLIVPGAMAWLRLSTVGTSDVAVAAWPTAIAAVCAVLQVVCYLAMPSITGGWLWQQQQKGTTTRSGEVPIADSADGDAADQLRNGTASAAGRPWLGGGSYGATDRAVAGQRPFAASDFALPRAVDSAPLSVVPDRSAGTAPFYRDGLWLLVVISIGVAISVAQCMLMVFPLVPFALLAAAPGTAYGAVPPQLVRSTAIVSAMMPLYAVGTLVAGAIFTFVPHKRHEIDMHQRFANVKRPLIVTIAAVSVVSACAIVLAASLDIAWLFALAPLGACALGVYAASKLSVAANIFETARFAITYGASRALGGVASFVLLLAVVVPVQEARIDRGDYFVVQLQRFCLGAGCYTPTFTSFAVLAAAVVVLDVSLLIYLHRAWGS